MTRAERFIWDPEDLIILDDPEDLTKINTCHDELGRFCDTRFSLVNARPGLSGAHEKELWEDASGAKWIFKPVPASKSIIPYAEEAASKIGLLVSDNTIEVHRVKLNGKEGSIQKVAGNLSQDQSFRLDKLKDSEIKQLQKEHVVDWLTSNHDAHPNQFLRTTDGKVLGIDKAQAYKHLGQDRLSVDYHPNAAYGERPPIYNSLFKEVKAGKIKIDPQVPKAAIEKASSIPDSKIRQILTPMAEARFKTKPEQNEFLDKAVARKNNLKHDFEKFYSAMTGEPVTFGKSLVLVPDLFQEITKYNPCHVPTGSKGGQFCSGGGGKLVGGHFKAGSKMATIYGALADGNIVSKTELKAALVDTGKMDAAKLKGGLNHLKKVGEKSGDWKVVEGPGTITLVKTPLTSPSGAPYQQKPIPKPTTSKPVQSYEDYYKNKLKAISEESKPAPIPGQKLLEGKRLSYEETVAISKQYVEKLTPAEKSALTAYTGDKSGPINNTALRSGKGEIDLQTALKIKHMDSAIKKHTLNEDVLLTRGVASSVAAKYTEGEVFIDLGFHSTTTKTTSGFGQHTINIRLKAGMNAAPVQSLSHHPGELEFLLPRGTMFKVLSVRAKPSAWADESGFKIIDVETL